jgi:hypothetical protein
MSFSCGQCASVVNVPLWGTLCVCDGQNGMSSSGGQCPSVANKARCPPAMGSVLRWRMGRGVSQRRTGECPCHMDTLCYFCGRPGLGRQGRNFFLWLVLAISSWLYGFMALLLWIPIVHERRTKNIFMNSSQAANKWFLNIQKTQKGGWQVQPLVL